MVVIIRTKRFHAYGFGDRVLLGSTRDGCIWRNVVVGRVVDASPVLIMSTNGFPFGIVSVLQ